MENILDVSKHIESFKLELVSETIDNMKFQLLELTQNLKDNLKSQGSYAGMIEFAAESGVSIDRVRACDDAKYLEGLESVWKLAAIQDDNSGTIKKMVAEKVCEISGLLEFVEAKNKEEVEADRKALEDEEAEQEYPDGICPSVDEIAQASEHPSNA